MKTGNIQNLTSLWLLAGKAFNAAQIVSKFEIVNISFSEWPNRIWSLEQITSDKKDIVKQIMQKNNPAMTFSVFQDLSEENHADDYGLKMKNLQVGITLPLKDYNLSQIDSRIELVLVDNQECATLWSNLFQQSFGYTISDKIVMKIKDQVEFYNLKYNNLFVGTVAIYRLDNSIGIHSLGIIPQFRNKGFAEESMKVILAKAKKDNLNYAHLQSSFMGINIYKKLGFKEIFNVYNYILI